MAPKKPTHPLLSTPVRESGYLYQLQVRDVQRLELLDLALDAPGVTVVEGKNAQGKTAVLSAIAMLVGGKVVDDPVRHGATEGSVAGDFGDRAITMTISPDREAKRQMIGKDGRPFPGGVVALQKALGPYGLDPCRLLGASDEDQLNVVIDLCPGASMADLDAEEERVYAARTDLNRDAKTYRAQALAVAVPEPPAEIGEEWSLADLMRRQREAQEQQRAVEQAEREAKLAETILGRTTAKIAAMEEELEGLRRQLRGDQRAASETAERVAAIARPNLAELEQEVAGLELHNVQVRAAKQRAADHSRATAERARLDGLAAAKEQESKASTDRLDEIAATRRARIAVATLPVKGLSVGKKRLLLDTGLGAVPLAQASGAERFDAAARIVGARCEALGLPLRLLVIDECSMDQDHLRELAAWAGANRYQVVITRALVGQEPTGVVIENGKVAGDHRKPGAAQAPAPASKPAPVAPLDDTDDFDL